MSYKIILLILLIAFISSKQFQTDLETIENSEFLLGASNGGKADTIVSCAKSKVGYPYVFGQAGPNSFDCSGLALFCHKQAKIAIERRASAQATKGTKVSRSNLKAGDLVFFDWDGDKSVDHVGIYIGGGYIVHAADESKGVVKANINTNYWVQHFHSARRYW